MIRLARLTAQPPWGPLTPPAQRTGRGLHSAIHPPVDELRRAEGHHLLVAEGEGVGHLPRLSAQRHHLVVGGHAVEGGAVQRAEGLEVLEGTRLLERLLSRHLAHSRAISGPSRAISGSLRLHAGADALGPETL